MRLENDITAQVLLARNEALSAERRAAAQLTRELLRLQFDYRSLQEENARLRAELETLKCSLKASRQS